jgi:hypothetical protein
LSTLDLLILYAIGVWISGPIENMSGRRWNPTWHIHDDKTEIIYEAGDE